jgi:hypothetical protein
VVALAVTLQWADAMTFAVIAAVLPNAPGELNPLPLGVGGTLLVKAALMLAVVLIARRHLRGSRLLLAWTALIGGIGFVTNAAFMIGAT